MPNDHTSTIAALKELRDDDLLRYPRAHYQQAIDDAVEGLEGLVALQKAILEHTPLIDMLTSVLMMAASLIGFKIVRDTEDEKRSVLARAELDAARAERDEAMKVLQIVAQRGRMEGKIARDFLRKHKVQE